MKGNIGKGTEMFRFFADFYKLCGDFWIAETNEKYWEQLLLASEELLVKYKWCDFFPFAKVLILALNVYLSDVKLKNLKNGNWLVSFKGENKT